MAHSHPLHLSNVWLEGKSNGFHVRGPLVHCTRFNLVSPSLQRGFLCTVVVSGVDDVFVF